MNTNVCVEAGQAPEAPVLPKDGLVEGTLGSLVDYNSEMERYRSFAAFYKTNGAFPQAAKIARITTPIFPSARIGVSPWNCDNAAMLWGAAAAAGTTAGSSVGSSIGSSGSRKAAAATSMHHHHHHHHQQQQQQAGRATHRNDSPRLSKQQQQPQPQQPIPPPPDPLSLANGNFLPGLTPEHCRPLAASAGECMNKLKSEAELLNLPERVGTFSALPTLGGISLPPGVIVMTALHSPAAAAAVTDSAFQLASLAECPPGAGGGGGGGGGGGVAAHHQQVGEVVAVGETQPRRSGNVVGYACPARGLSTAESAAAAGTAKRDTRSASLGNARSSRKNQALR